MQHFDCDPKHVRRRFASTARQIMPLSTLTAALKYLLDTRTEKKKRTADYLDAIASSASRLADVWRDTVSHCARREIKDSDFAGWFRVVAAQTGLFGEIQNFYGALDCVLPRGSTNTDREQVESRLLTLLRCRETARQKLGLLLTTNADARDFFIDQDFDSLLELQGAVLDIQSEAAAIGVLAKTFRASI